MTDERAGLRKLAGRGQVVVEETLDRAGRDVKDPRLGKIRLLTRSRGRTGCGRGRRDTQHIGAYQVFSDGLRRRTAGAPSSTPRVRGGLRQRARGGSRPKGDPRGGGQRGVMPADDGVPVHAEPGRRAEWSRSRIDVEGADPARGAPPPSRSGGEESAGHLFADDTADRGRGSSVAGGRVRPDVSAARGQPGDMERRLRRNGVAALAAGAGRTAWSVRNAGTAPDGRCRRCWPRAACPDWTRVHRRAGCGTSTGVRLVVACAPGAGETSGVDGDLYGRPAP
ncbi:hypothetical protein SMICM304S_06278 [Streptomyces microflavus]